MTSGDRGYFLGRSLAMAYVSPDLADGEEIEVVSASSGETHTGVVSTKPFHDPGGVQLRT